MEARAFCSQQAFPTQSNIFEKARACLSGTPFKCSPIGVTSSIILEYQIKLERLVRNKRSSLFEHRVPDEDPGKHFHFKLKGLLETNALAYLNRGRATKIKKGFDSKLVTSPLQVRGRFQKVSILVQNRWQNSAVQALGNMLTDMLNQCKLIRLSELEPTL